ncbi:MAG: COX15/CtaA family protein [Candidatus Nanopelagicaceae bacterium]
MKQVAERSKLWFSATSLLALQMLLVVTGGLVRVTGSGLGCPTWPKCTKDSYVPDQSQSHIHVWIEFGNRMLTFALFGAAFTTLYFAWKRRELRLLAALQVLGILGQGILGGITVLTKLNPIPVAGHLLLSMVLIAAATNLQFKVQEYREIPDAVIGKTLATFAFLTLIAGTIVTGSGPHAGDWQAPRFDFNIELAAKIHSALVATTLIIAIYIAIKLPRKSANWLLVAIMGQASIGLIQWWLGLPQVLVGLHLLGASLFWFAAWRTRLSFRYQRITESIK